MIISVLIAYMYLSAYSVSYDFCKGRGEGVGDNRKEASQYWGRNKAISYLLKSTAYVDEIRSELVLFEGVLSTLSHYREAGFKAQRWICRRIACLKANLSLTGSKCSGWLVNG